MKRLLCSRKSRRMSSLNPWKIASKARLHHHCLSRTLRPGSAGDGDEEDAPGGRGKVLELAAGVAAGAVTGSEEGPVTVAAEEVDSPHEPTGWI